MSISTDFIQFLNGFRKWTVMMVIISICVWFRLSDHITGDQFERLLRYTVVAFMGTNGLEHITRCVMKWLEKK